MNFQSPIGHPRVKLTNLTFQRISCFVSFSRHNDSVVQAERFSTDQRLNVRLGRVRNGYRSFRERKYERGILAKAASSASKEISGRCLKRKKGE